MDDEVLITKPLTRCTCGHHTYWFSGNGWRCAQCVPPPFEDLVARRVPLACNFPGWWSKLELFRPDVFTGPVLYVDLDTLPCGPLADMAGHTLDFAMLSDVWEPTVAQSGVMAWIPGETSARVWDVFVESPRDRMRAFRGDGEFIRSVADPVTRLQDVFPGRIAGFKVRRPRGIIPEPPRGASLVVAHGDPRFSDPAAGWAHETWTERAA